MMLPYAATVLLVVATLYSAIVSFRRADTANEPGCFPEATSRSTRIVLGGFTLALWTGLAVWLGVSARNSTRPASRFLIPDGYTGWVRIEFEVQDAPPLAKEDGEYIVKIPSDGVPRTSSAEQYGWAKDHYYYYSAEGTPNPSPLILPQISAPGPESASGRTTVTLLPNRRMACESSTPT
jgi:hypothetical protein